ncbi:hypothetical protein RUND412_002892 [Rhizina undulata]
MNSSQKDVAGTNELDVPRLSPTGYEYYLMIPSPSGCTPEVPTYRKLLLALDPSDTLDEHQVVAIEDLLKERNARTEIEGEWVLSGLRMAVGSENFELIIKFRGYSDFVVLRGMDVVTEAVEDCRNDAPDVDVSNSRETAMIVAEGAVAEISGTDSQQPASFVDDSDFESTVGRRSPTPTSDTGSGATTPVLAVVRTEKKGKSTSWILWKNLPAKCDGHLDLEGSTEGSENIDGQRASADVENDGSLWALDERTLTAMYKLANATYFSGDWTSAWPIFSLVLEGRVEVLGKTHKETLDTLNDLRKSTVKTAIKDHMEPKNHF